MSQQERHTRRSRISRWSGALYVAPSFLILLVIAVVPIICSIYFSFTDYDIFSSPQFTGLDNYKDLFADANFWNALKITIIFTVISVPLQLLIALGIAEVLSKTKHRRLSSIMRSLLFVPAIASLVIVGAVWKYLLAADSGLFNIWLSALGLNTVNFLGNPGMALLSVALVSVWKGIGYYLVFFYAGVLDIPRDYYEAAEIDGASRLQQFFNITLPSLRPIILLCLILATIGSFQVFDLVYVMTGGGPGGATTTIVMLIYQAGFENFRMGYASAIAMILMLFIIAASVIQNRIMKEKD
ncbi:carbohydrate ABC transporter permease [Neoactinobaculum massilliense]|uniref:carbohydrate ABC transporter permease n=1 Tax=Neoactinobaculum massilliense TaxID=2364794 RepID=UPI000F51B46A|nr:sugar ABC transporter permease [Neoactinobaculum massilliense]